MNKKEILKRGTQIVYVPNHADGDLKHEDCEYGFVITDKGESAFCRYFLKDKSLRTVANSELTPKDMLIVANHRPQKDIDTWVKNIEHAPEIYGSIYADNQTLTLNVREGWGIFK